MVEHDIGRHPEAAAPPVARKGQMHVHRERVREPVEGERGLVRDHASSLGPEPSGDQLLVLARGEVDEPVGTSAHAEGLARVDVVDHELRRVARLGRLLGREQPLLGRRRVEEAVPVRVGRNLIHAHNVNQLLFVCKAMRAIART